MAVQLVGFILSFQAVLVAGHIRNRCDDLPLVVLRKDPTTGSFAVHSRISDTTSASLPSGFAAEAGLQARRRRLQALTALDYEEASTGSFRDWVSGLRGSQDQESVPGFWASSISRNLHGSEDDHIHGDEDGNSTSHLDWTKKYGDDDEDLYLAKECSCFDSDLSPNETFFCPMAVTTCREVRRGAWESIQGCHTATLVGILTESFPFFRSSTIILEDPRRMFVNS